MLVSTKLYIFIWNISSCLNVWTIKIGMLTLGKTGSPQNFIKICCESKHPWAQTTKDMKACANMAHKKETCASKIMLWKHILAMLKCQFPAIWRPWNSNFSHLTPKGKIITIQANSLTNSNFKKVSVGELWPVHGPFLWMGFNCLKARATSRMQFSFYH